MTIIPLTIDLLSGSHESRFSEVEKFLSRDREKRSRLSILVNIPVSNSVFGYNKTEADLQRMFNGYIKTTTYSLFPETLGTFW